MTQIIKISDDDNVAVALASISEGVVLNIGNKSITVGQYIPMGHKIALRDFQEGEMVVKYGAPIGHTTKAIRQGFRVDETNIATNLRGVLDYNYEPCPCPESNVIENYTFNGYKRANGSVGTRNEIWIVPTVGCVNGVATRLASLLNDETRCDGVDAIVAFTHNYGCSQLGDDHNNTRSILRDIILHPNAGGVLVVGLGCENNQPDALREMLGDYDENRIRFLITQQADDEIEVGMNMLRQIYNLARHDRRIAVPISHLKVGLKCGGSDGLSGITANPLLGRFSDLLTAHGGTTVLTEVPEMFGAETLLMNRCNNRDTFNKTVDLINNFKRYFINNSQPVYENPSPGNKAGGISTLEEKSLGCTQKSGRSVVTDVLNYGEILTTHGLNLLSAPGNDLVASTALAAAGCQLVLFTTGRGTPFGTFVPTMKISTNTALASNKPKWIDFNAGTIIDGEQWDSLLDRFVHYVISVASGEWVNNEKNDYREIAFFKSGVTL